MAFPVVAARASGRTSTANTTTHAVTLPTGIVAGNLLVVVFSTDQVPTITVNTGVSGLNWNALTAGSNGSIVTGNVFWKIAEGGDALTLTTSTSEQSSHVSLRITGGFSVTGTSANGSSTNSNPPNHAPPDGTQDSLWIATRHGDSTVVATVAPADFTDLQTLAAAGTNGASTNTAERSLNAASLDPGTFTSASEQWVAFTVAVSPVEPPGEILQGSGAAVGGAVGAADASRFVESAATWGGAPVAWDDAPGTWVQFVESAATWGGAPVAWNDAPGTWVQFVESAATWGGAPVAWNDAPGTWVQSTVPSARLRGFSAYPNGLFAQPVASVTGGATVSPGSARTGTRATATIPGAATVKKTGV